MAGTVMSGKTTARLSHEDAKTIRRAVAWLANIDRLDGLQEAVGMDLADILDEALKTRAVVNIRIVNAGTPPSEKFRQAVRTNLAKGREAHFGFGAPDWSTDEDERLRHLWTQTDTPSPVIAEELGRTVGAVQERASYLGCRRAPGLHASGNPKLTRVRAVIARRRQEEARQRREESA
jgi:hypothetical protein